MHNSVVGIVLARRLITGGAAATPATTTVAGSAGALPALGIRLVIGLIVGLRRRLRTIDGRVVRRRAVAFGCHIVGTLTLGTIVGVGDPAAASPTTPTPTSPCCGIVFAVLCTRAVGLGIRIRRTAIGPAALGLVAVGLVQGRLVITGYGGIGYLIADDLHCAVSRIRVGCRAISVQGRPPVGTRPAAPAAGRSGTRRSCRLVVRTASGVGGVWLESRLLLGLGGRQEQRVDRVAGGAWGIAGDVGRGIANGIDRARKSWLIRRNVVRHHVCGRAVSGRLAAEQRLDHFLRDRERD